MINLSTSAAAHAYACRSGGTGMVVSRSVPNSRGIRSITASVASADSAMETAVGGLEMLSQGYGSIGFRNNRFQYEIPTVGQHYGNAFHLTEDDDDVRDFLVEHQRYGTDVHHDIMEEHIAEDDDEEEDIEMSTGVEVISIDPNCDYDTDEEEEEEEDEEEEDDNEEDIKCKIDAKNEKVPEYENGASGKEAALFQPTAILNVAMVNDAQNVTQSVDPAPATVLRNDGEVYEMYSSVGGVHCHIQDELVEDVNRSRSRISANTDISSSSSSSRDSSTSSTYVSDKDSSNQLPFASTRPAEEQEQGAVVHQYHQSYHSEEDEDEEEVEDDDDDDDDPGLDFSPSKNTLWELPAKLLQDTSGRKKSKTQPHGRRKRCSTSQRQSFSMPHSPVGAGTVESGPVIGGGLLPTSLSFDDLDSLVCDLSPLKNVSTGKASTHGLEEDDLLADPLANASNFDLTAYITGDDDNAPCETAGQRRKVEPVQSPPKRVLPKSRGKELKVLRQHMMLLEPQDNEVELEPASNGKRDSAAKAVRKLTMDDESSDSEDEDVAQQTNSKKVDNRNETRGIRRVSKRKLVDDTDKDPTWNPNGVGSSNSSSSKTKFETKVSNQKQSTTPGSTTSSVGVGLNAGTSKPVIGSNQCSSSGEEACSKPPPPSAIVKKGIKFGQVIKTESSGSRFQAATACLSKKSPNNGVTPKPTTAKVETGRDHHNQAHTNVHRKKTNVKLDHDYCSPKRVSHIHTTTGGNSHVPGSLSIATAAGGGGVGSSGSLPRKTIEIPFLLPTKEQLRQERKLQKEKKRTDQPTSTVATKKQLVAQSSVSSTSSDNAKDKQVQQYRGGSGASKSPLKIAASASGNGPLSNNSPKPLSTSEAKRSDVNETCVNKIATAVGSRSGSGGANEVSQSAKMCATIPNAIGGSVKRQISLLKINQPGKGGAVTTSHVSNGNSAQEKTVETISGNSSQQETIVTSNAADSTTLVEDLEGGKHEVVVRKKLNLQEYKKRREHPESSVQKASDPIIRQQYVSRDSTSNGSPPINSTSGYSNSSKCPNSNGVVIAKPEPTQITKPDRQSMHQNSLKPQEPLDPISAAKMKALRMQQLKKEAAIKSNEVKLSQKTIPLMPILPLAQITSLEFDEHGNPLPLDDASNRAGQNMASSVNDSLKLHPDYEEIIIVSIGCNTSLTIEPSEKDSETGVDHLPNGAEDDRRHQHQNSTQQGPGSEKEVTRLLNISDTIKRCCPSVDTMPGSSLIASIQEVMIKKSNKSTPNPQGLMGMDASIAEGAVTLKAETMPAVGSGARDQQQQYLLHQTSPYVGVSPPSSFSPGKPERAQTTNARTMGDEGPVKPSRTSKVLSCPPATTTAVIATQTDIDAAVDAVTEHGEDKVIMHLRKDRVRAQRIDAATQTDPCGRFPPLCKLALPSMASIEDSGSSNSSSKDSSTILLARQREQQKRTERQRSYRRLRRRNGSESPSDADSDAASDRHPSGRSKSHQERHHRVRDRNSHSHSRSRSRHRSSRRRSSCSSGSRSRSRSGYSSRVHLNHHNQQPHCIADISGGCNNTSNSRYSRSRRKSRTCSRSSSSTSSSRYGSRGRRSLSSSSSTSSMSSSGASDGAVHRTRSRSRSPRSRSRSGKRSSTPDRQHYHTRERVINNHRRAISPERNIVYVGRLESTVSKEDLQQKFEPYGKIVKITLHVKANGSRYGFVTFEKPQHAYDAIDACGTDANLRNYDVSFGGRRAFCRTQYADLDGEVSNDHDHQMPYVTLDGSLLLPSRGPLPYSVVPAVCHKESMMYGSAGALAGSGTTGGESFDDLLKKFKKEISARRT
ncbi:serine-rich adhesin for platelets [Anopheles maculipalpis]|uniref:serine-rich adhesin for platelets n=1 Tax=Anopheles maculipalpis TaxID=1496333 RepID=UPI0021590478|nr:serine-rich adhesin for platelets [Anopheles maculipalpis]